MVDPGEDFHGYMEGMARVEAEREATRELLQRHEEWRQTTWTGWGVRQIQSFARNIEPTVSQIVSTFGDNDSASSAIVINMMRFLILLVLISTIYVVSQFLNKFLGETIIVEEEVVILHEFETKEEAESAREKDFRGRMNKGNKDD